MRATGENVYTAHCHTPTDNIAKEQMSKEEESKSARLFEKDIMIERWVRKAK